jgi:hypothetical protein
LTSRRFWHARETTGKTFAAGSPERPGFLWADPPTMEVDHLAYIHAKPFCSGLDA